MGKVQIITDPRRQALLNEQAAYRQKLAAMDDKQLERECYDMIYHAARCENNPHACWHWMVDICYEVSKGRPGRIYGDAYGKCVAENT